MKNVHQRLLDHPIAEVRPWIARAWSGSDADIFPRDRIRNWRRNPDDVAPAALVPGITKMGHGPFSFVLREWDGNRWRVDFGRGEARGWHGFDLEEVGGRTRITHTLEAPFGLATRALIIPVHDWAVEALFDRLETALATGAVPRATERRPPRLFAAYQAVRRLVRRGARIVARPAHARG
jgi:hypothetical protein